MDLHIKLFLTNILFLFSVSSYSITADFKVQISNVFGTKYEIVPITVTDTISDKPINIQLLKLMKGKTILGYARSISTTTGCNSACLPLNYFTFYDPSGRLLKLSSKDGLTKIGHAAFTKEDYSNLEFILAMAPAQFGEIIHPKELTDALSGATLVKYQQIVVKGAAYSTLRVHLYNQDTINIIKKLK